MTDDEYRQLVSQAQNGTLLIGLDRSVARKFYTDVPLKHVERETGEAPYFEKIVVLGAFLFAPLSLAASFVLAVLAFGWWAALAIPVSLVAYFLFSGQSSMPNRWMVGVTLILVIVVAATLLRAFPSEYIAWYFVSLAFSFWAAHLVYAAATLFLRSFVLRNKKAFEMVAPHIHVREGGA